MITITREPYGQTLQGEEVACFHMGNSNGMTVDVLEYGSTVRSICVPSGNGRTVDVVLGYDRLSDYEKGTCVSETGRSLSPESATRWKRITEAIIFTDASPTVCSPGR